MKKVICLIVAMAMLVLCLASCGDNNTDTTTEQGTTATTSTSATTASTEATTTDKPEEPKPGYTKPEGYYDVSLDNITFTFVSTQDWVDEVGRWCNGKEIAVESRDGGTPIDTAVYDRNAVMKSLYGCNIVCIDTPDSASAGALIENDIISNTAEVDFGSVQTGIFMGNAKGYYYNLFDLNPDFNLDGWNMDYINQVACKDNNGVLKLYSFDADFNLVGYRAIWTLCMNLDLFEQNFSDQNIFDIVANKQWTIDKMTELCSAVTTETGDQVMTVGDDTFGLLTTAHNAFGLIAASGIRITENIDGEIVTSPDLIKSHNAVDAIDKMIELYKLEGVKSDNGYTSNQEELENGRTLFIGEVFDILERMKDSEVNAVCLPQPLYSSEQDGYYSNVNTKLSTWVISKNACGGNVEMLSDFLNVFVYHSNKIVLPAFIATFGGIYCQNQRATELVETIMSHRVYDMGYHPGGIYGLISTMVSSANNNLATACTKWVSKTLTPAINNYKTSISAN